MQRTVLSLRPTSCTGSYRPGKLSSTPRSDFAAFLPVAVLHRVATCFLRRVDDNIQPKHKRVNIKMTRQRKYQLKMKTQGRCVVCGKPAVTSQHCRFHADQMCERIKKRYAAKKTLRPERPHYPGFVPSVDGAEGRETHANGSCSPRES